MVLDILSAFAIMVSMNFKNIIQDLMQSGWSQADIATHCNTGQSHISGLCTGDRKMPGYDLGVSLVALHKRVMRRQKQS